MDCDPADHSLNNNCPYLICLTEGVQSTDREHSVGELARIEAEKLGTISARLKVLLTARLVKRRRAGQTAFYAIADTHVLDLIRNAIDHAGEHR